ncbi:MAG TPA: TIGR04282 family arsenosugar biosynthesis glycosyltransferase [Burkholderiaceae bacterium]|nr:TIGR04282 family arsenosugar biosynthesis glycosyltransferase [Burkholderiaceae bacterium]
MAARIVIFAKAPVPGFAKTRLIPALGEAQAAQLARRMLLHTLREAHAADAGPVELCVTPGPADPAWKALPPVENVTWTEQTEGDLGARLAHVAARVIDGGERVLLIGTDCPQLDASRLRRAGRLLENSDAVMLPTFDGGYALLGLRKFDPRVFAAMPWSTDRVAAVTGKSIRAMGWSLDVGRFLHDIDEPADLQWLPDGWPEFRFQDEGFGSRQDA